MKKAVLLVSICCIFLLNGCSKISITDNIFSENNINTDEHAEIEDISLTAEEEQIMCDYFIGEERIREGKLYTHQVEYLNQLRFSREYLENKYHGTEFYIKQYNCPTVENVIGTMTFQVEQDSDKYYELHIEIEDGIYNVSDNYYGDLIRNEYDEAVRKLIEDELGVHCTVYTLFKDTKGSEINASLTAEQIFALGDKLSRDTNIFLDYEIVDEQDIMQKIKSIMSDNNLYGSYTMFIGKDLLKKERTAEQLREYALQYKGEEVEAYFFDCFNVGE